MAVTVQITEKVEDFNYSAKNLKKLVKDVCKRFNIANAAIDIQIVGDKKIRELNRRFLNHNLTSDCLSFDLSDSSGYPPVVYQLVVNAQMAKRQAKKRRLHFEAELALYIIHSMLHNLGFDDCNQKQAERMHAIEDEILRRYGYGLVYNKEAEK